MTGSGAPTVGDARRPALGTTPAGGPVKLYVRHTFPCDPETFWRMYWDDDFDAMMRRESTVERELLEQREVGGVLIRRVRFTPQRELPGPAAKVLGSKKLIYEQENRWDREASRMNWRVVPTVLPGKLDAKGTFVVKPAAGGCEQIVDGEITVNVMFIGGQIEKAVVAEVEQSYDKMAVVAREWLQKHGNA